MEQPDILAKRIAADSYEHCIVVCAYLADGFSSELAYRVRDVLNGLDTDGWWFFNPGMFIVAFRTANRGAERAKASMTILARLPRSVAGLERLGVGAAQGEVLTALASAGHLDTPPLGEIVNAAFHDARKNAS